MTHGGERGIRGEKKEGKRGRRGENKEGYRGIRGEKKEGERGRRGEKKEGERVRRGEKKEGEERATRPHKYDAPKHKHAMKSYCRTEGVGRWAPPNVAHHTLGANGTQRIFITSRRILPWKNTKVSPSLCWTDCQ